MSKIIKKKRGKRFLLVCALLLFVLSLVRLIDNVDYWIVDILSHFPFQFALLAFVLLIICFWKRFIPIALLCTFLFILNIITLIDVEQSLHAEKYGGTTFKVYSANINRFNKDLSNLIEDMREIDAEINLLFEVTPQHLEMLKPVIRRFPYHIEFTRVGKLGIGVVLLSKFPVLDYRKMILSSNGNALIESTIVINQKKAVFYALHSQSPLFISDFAKRKKQFLWLANRISNESLPVIVAGDFNATPFSPIYRKFLRISGLQDTREGFGWQPSWPTFLPFLWIPIDHILVSPEINVHKRATGSFIGSDHYPVSAELSIF